MLDGKPAPNPLPARVAVFDERKKTWIRDISYGGFDMQCSAGTRVQWSPRAVVFGPDNALYVSAMKFVSGQNPNELPGRIIGFPKSGRCGAGARRR